jgi:hypothetical protein
MILARCDRKKYENNKFATKKLEKPLNFSHFEIIIIIIIIICHLANIFPKK